MESEESVIAAITHEVNRQYCARFGNDNSQPAWEDAPEWQRSSALNGVRGIISGEVKSPKDSHESWMKEKLANGWKFGDVKDPEAKTHPCLVPYEQLSLYQRRKDELFRAVVLALKD